MHVIGDVDGRNALIVDDIIDTAGTLTKTVDALKEKGANRVWRRASTASSPARRSQRINESPLERCSSPTRPRWTRSSPCLPKLRPLSVAPLLGEAIRRIHENSSVSSLFV